MREFSLEEIDQSLVFLPGTYAVCCLGKSLKTIRFSADIPPMLGYSDAEFRGCLDRGLMDLIDSEERGSLAKNLQKLVSQEGSLEFLYHVRRKDGGLLNIQTFARCPGKLNGEPLISISFCAAPEDAEFERSIIDRISNTEFDYVAIIDVESSLIHFRSLKPDCFIAPSSELSDYGRLLGECLGRTVLPEELAPALAALSLPRICEKLSAKSSYVYSTSMHDDEGHKRRKQYKFSYLDESHRKILFVRSDVTESFTKEREIEERLEESSEQLKIALTAARQASTAKSNFLSRMSHEIRTPMNAIIGMSTLAAQAVGNDEKVADCISKIGILRAICFPLSMTFWICRALRAARCCLKMKNLTLRIL